MTIVHSSHILLDDQNVAWIENSSIKVLEIALDHIAHGWSPEEIRRQHPHIPPSHIYAALSYYHDHRPEFDATIARQLEHYDQELAKSYNSPIRQRLRSQGKL